MHQGYGFVEFVADHDADYCVKILNMIKVFGKPIRINKASSDRRDVDIGATIFVGNLGTEADENTLTETFSRFGRLTQQPKIARDEATFASKGFGFVSFDSFEASDKAIESMDGQYLAGNAISVNYAFKKDGKGERHGSEAGTFCCLSIQNGKGCLKRRNTQNDCWQRKQNKTT